MKISILSQESAFLRLKQIIPSILPISKSAWWAGVKDGRYPAPIKLSENVTVWRASDIAALVERINAQAPAPTTPPTSETATDAPVRRGRGRPKGAKNKPKSISATAQAA